MSNFEADVIVVGCGPVGVMAALRCAQRGLRVIAIDRSNEIYPLPRALAMDDEIQDLFARAGLSKDLQKQSTPLRGGEFVNAAGERVVGIEVPDDTVGALGYPPIVVFDQPGVERFLRTAAVRSGVDMRLGLDAFAIEDTTDGVLIEAGDDTGEVSLSARWLIAADGAKSTIRSLRGISMVDQGFDQTWLVVDTTLLDSSVAFPTVARQVCDPSRICTLVPGHGDHRRWEFRLRPDETREDILREEVIAELLAPWGTAEQLQVNRAAVYRFHANVAEAFRDGPVFLAGDSAHQMPPFNGQGMCTGLRDAENLSWKLAYVAAERAGDALLDTYDAERRPHAAEQVAHSVDSGLLMDAIAFNGDAALESGYGQRPFPKASGGLFSDDHSLVGSVLPRPLVPHSELGRGWNLLSLQPPLDPPELWAQLGAARVQVPSGAYPGLVEDRITVIVRPDRYVTAVTTDLEDATRTLAPLIS